LVVAVTKRSTVPSVPLPIAVDELVSVSPAVELKFENTSDCPLRVTAVENATSIIPPSNKCR
jgi:hypothetical protein